MTAKDAHIHLSTLPTEQQKKYFQEAEKLKIISWALGGYDEADWLKQIELKKLQPQIKTCFGIHPWTVQDHSVENIEKQFQKLLSLAYQADAIGETGIDRFRTRDEKVIAIQQNFFKRSLELAVQQNKPVVLHIVQAHEMALKILDLFPQTYGIAHAFSGSAETAREYIRRNYLISIGPAILKDGFKQLKDAVKEIPLNHMLIESDDHFEVLNLHQVAKKVAELKACVMDEVLKATAGNFDRTFK